MAAITYPSNLPDFKLGKQREQEQTFRTNEPFNGPLFVEKITDESPVAWNVTITCKTSGQARVFQAFLRTIPNGTPFNKSILIEEGFVEHEVRFIEMPLTPTQIGTGNVWEYSGVIYAVKLIQPDTDINNDALIIAYIEDANIIDNALNNLWPVA